MGFKIVELDDFSGNKAKIYSVIEDGSENSFYDDFVVEHLTFRKELRFLSERLKQIGQKHGAADQFFDRPEGSAGEDIFALYDEPGAVLRLYCIRLGKIAIILGGGGVKQTDKWQEDSKLTIEMERMKMVVKCLDERLSNGEIRWKDDTLEGNLYFN